MAGRALLMAVSLAVLAAAGYASWYGIGTVDRDTGTASVRAGSAIVGGASRPRVK
ncbi:MAG: hypothetical protein WBA25_15460 [Jannaschia sp.]